MSELSGGEQAKVRLCLMTLVKANFLIFDDDMNSGATLKLVCDALQDKLDNSDNKIKCLVNGFSLNGR